jgi:hypothetical protein
LTASDLKLFPNLPKTLLGRNKREIIDHLEGATPPSWFRNHLERSLQMSIPRETLVEEWETFRNVALGGGGGSISDITFEETLRPEN